MTNRQGLQDAEARNLKIINKLKLASMTIVLAADNYQITVDHPPVLYIDPGDAVRDVLLPAIDENSAGLTFFIFNFAGTATEVITLKTSADGAITPAPAIIKDEGAMVTNNGVEWRCIVGPNT